jgi:hypothetical protein
MDHLARALCVLEDFAGARVLLKQVLLARERVLGSEHPETLATMDALVDTLCRLGEHDSATVLLERVLIARRRSASTSEHVMLR